MGEIRKYADTFDILINIVLGNEWPPLGILAFSPFGIALLIVNIFFKLYKCLKASDCRKFSS